MTSGCSSYNCSSSFPTQPQSALFSTHSNSNSHTGCPSGTYAAQPNSCRDCPKGSFCLGGQATGNENAPPAISCSVFGPGLTTLGSRTTRKEGCGECSGWGAGYELSPGAAAPAGAAAAAKQEVLWRGQQRREACKSYRSRIAGGAQTAAAVARRVTHSCHHMAADSTDVAAAAVVGVCCCCCSVNLPGYFYSLGANGDPVAIPCPPDTYQFGLRKQRACVPCPISTSTFNKTMQTSIAACGESGRC